MRDRTPRPRLSEPHPRPGPLSLTMRSFNYTRDVDTTDQDNERSAVVHLVPYVFPVRRLVDWYDSLADINRDEPDIYELDEIVVALQALPRLPGQLGRDIALIADATDDTFRSDIIDAIGRLRRLGTLEILDDPNPDFLLDNGNA